MIDVTEFSDVLAEDDHRWIAAQRVIEAMIDDLESVEHRRIVCVGRRHLGGLKPAATQFIVIALIVFALMFPIPVEDLFIAGRVHERAGESAHRIATERRLHFLQLVFRLGGAEAIEEIDNGFDVGIDRCSIRFPRAALRFANRLQIFAFVAVELVRAGDSLSDHPLAHLADASELNFPLQPLFRFVSLLTS